jgi:hypothetical protein
METKTAGNWIGSTTIDELLDQVVTAMPVIPPAADSVYLISGKPWKNSPDHSCDPLYVGGNTGKSERFRTRVGDLIADMFGFYNADRGHSSGGQSLHAYCKKENINPKELHIGWLHHSDCRRCAEVEWFERLQPKLNKKRPSKCKTH